MRNHKSQKRMGTYSLFNPEPDPVRQDLVVQLLPAAGERISAYVYDFVRGEHTFC